MDEVQAKAHELAIHVGAMRNAFVGPNSEYLTLPSEGARFDWVIVAVHGTSRHRASIVDLNVLGMEQRSLLLAARAEELDRRFSSVRLFGSASSLEAALDAALAGQAAVNRFLEKMEEAHSRVSRSMASLEDKRYPSGASGQAA